MVLKRRLCILWGDEGLAAAFFGVDECSRGAVQGRLALHRVQGLHAVRLLHVRQGLVRVLPQPDIGGSEEAGAEEGIGQGSVVSSQSRQHACDCLLPTAYRSLPQGCG